MKKLIYLIPIFLGLVVTSCYKDEIEEINNRLEQIENTKIASLSEQVNNIKVSLAKLEGVDGTLDAAIKGLDNLVGSLKTQLEDNASADASTKQELQKKIADAETLIAQLSAADELLDKNVKELASYVDTELAKSKNWAESTFTTLTQYYELESALLALGDLIEQTEEKISNEYTSAIANAIKESETSMKAWVNKTLADSYYDMAAIDAKLLLLEGKITDADTELAKQISNQQAALNQAVTEFSNTVQAGIATAVSEGGVINAEISEQIETAMGKVDIKLAVIDNAIAAINADIAAIRNDIASIQNQINSMKTSIGELQAVDAELDGYISTLTDQYETLSDAYETLSELINSGAGSGSGSISNAALEEYKAAVAGQLAVIEQAIETLQTSDEDLQGQIDDLQDNVDKGLSDTQDWAESTFATLAKFNQLSDVVATIKAQIETMSEQLEVRLSSLATKDELNAAISNLSSSVQADIQTAVNNCNTAMQTMQQELTSAYKSAISTAISSSETTMKSWVNNKLTSYYTAAQTDAKIASLKTNLEGQLNSQKVYLEGVISELESVLEAKIANNTLLITQLEGALENANSQITDLTSQVTTNTQKIASNAQSIKTNANSISENASDIANNSQAITAANKLISDNKKLIEENEQLIEENAEAIAALQKRATVNENAIQANAEAISANAEDIADNADLIAANAAAIVNNAAAISQNAADIQQIRADLEKAKNDITEAYQKAIKEAIETSEGKLNAKIAEEVATLNSRISSEVDAINETITALTSRVTACEKDIKTIKTNIYNIQVEIEDIQEQIATIMSRIQSFTYIPKYSDGRAAVSYTNNGTITPGNVTLDFNVLPSGTASELAKVWQTAISAEAVYTITRASVDIVPLTVLSVVAEGDYLTMVVSGENLSDDFYLGRTSANLYVKISDGNNERRSESVSLCPWTTDVIAFADPKFKTYLLENFDVNSDGEISEEEALDVTEIDCSYMQITSLSGIEYFTNLTSLNASFNKIETLDLRNNAKLTEVDVNNNNLTSFHVEGLSTLTSLDCSNNKLTELNVNSAKGLTALNCSNNSLGALNVSDNKALVELNCANNNIAQLNLKNNVALESLNVRKNALSLLDVTKQVALKDLECSNNNLTSLNVYSNTLLETLRCGKNQLKTIDVRHLAALSVFECSSNNLTLLDVTKNTALTILDASENALESLDLSCNTLLETVDCSDNTSLAKLWVKDETHQHQMTITKDESTNVFFNDGGLVFPDKALETYMLTNYDDDDDGVISIVEAENVTIVNCANKGISDLTGLESCTNLEYLNCSNNNLKVVDCHTLTKLVTLICYDNPIEVLDLSNCSALRVLNIQNETDNAIVENELKLTYYDQSESLTIDVTNTIMNRIYVCRSEKLAYLDVSNNEHLTQLSAYVNPNLKSIDVSKLIQLEVLDLGDCDLTNLDVSQNVLLTKLFVTNNKLSTLDVSQNKQLMVLKCQNNQISNLKVSNNTFLETLDVSDNQLSALNVRSNTALKDLRMSKNINITAINLKNNVALETLYADGLSISEINLVENSAIKRLSLLDNENLTSLRSWQDFSDISTLISIDHVVVMTNPDASTQNFPLIGTRLVDAQAVSGVVFKCDDSSCYIMSETYKNNVAWSTEEVTTGATNNSDGMVNMSYVKAKNPDLSKYPALKWCADYGSGWYLPALNELRTICSNRLTLNATLQKVNGKTLGTSYNYWSSTEASKSNVSILDFSNPNSDYYYGKSYTTAYVRAVCAL